MLNVNNTIDQGTKEFMLTTKSVAQVSSSRNRSVRSTNQADRPSKDG